MVHSPGEKNILLGRKMREQPERHGPGKTSAGAMCQVLSFTLQDVNKLGSPEESVKQRSRKNYLKGKRKSC